MRIIDHVFENINVLELLGKMTLGEGDQLLEDKINSLVIQDRKLIVLDLSSVPYIDSTALAELMRAYRTVSTQGGRLVLCSLTQRVLAVLSISKAIVFYEVYDSVEEAVVSFGILRLEVSCPVCRPGTWMACSAARLVSCPVCDVRFSISLSEADVTRALSDGTTTRVSYLWWQTYYENGFGHEQVQLKFGRPSTMSVSGRLDLFAFDVVLRAWEAVSRPRRIIFDLSAVRFFSPASIARLMELCANTDGTSKGVVLWGPGSPAPPPPGHEHLVGPAVFTNLSDAVRTLETVMDAPQSIDVHLRRRE